MTSRSQFFLPFLPLVMVAVGCTSSVKDSTNNPYAGDPDSGTIPDASDDRQLPEDCTGPEDCNDGDPCTIDTCGSNGKCLFEFKQVDLQPVPISTAGRAMDVSFHGDILYVAEADAGVEAFDITDPGSPVQMGASATEGEAIALDANASGVLVGLGEDGLEIFSPAPDLVQVQHIEPGNNVLGGMDTVTNIDIGPTTTIASVYVDGALFLNTDDFSALQDSGDVDTQGRTVAASSNGQAALIADSLGGATAILINGADGPEQSGSLPSDGRVLDVAVYWHTAALSEYGPGFSVLDFSDPTFPERLAYIHTPSPGVAVDLVGQQTLVTAEEDGRIVLHDLRRSIPPGPLQPREAGEWAAQSLPLRLATSSGLVAVALGEGGVVLLRTGCEQ